VLISDYVLRRRGLPPSTSRRDDLEAVRAHLLADAHAQGASDEHRRLLERVNARIWSRR